MQKRGREKVMLSERAKAKRRMEKNSKVIKTNYRQNIFI